MRAMSGDAGAGRSLRLTAVLPYGGSMAAWLARASAYPTTYALRWR
jgi:hypothetical protein